MVLYCPHRIFLKNIQFHRSVFRTLLFYIVLHCVTLFSLIITHLSFTFLVVNNRWTMVIKKWSCTKNSADLDEKSDDYNQPKGRKCTWKGRMFRKMCLFSLFSLFSFRKARDNFWTKSIEKINDYRNLFVRYIQVYIYIYIYI